jgi:hypothetical protein
MAQHLYERDFAQEFIERERERNQIASDHESEGFQGDNRSRLAGKVPFARTSDKPPHTCTDGSLVIDAEGQVRKATPEQQQIALEASAARAKAWSAGGRALGEAPGSSARVTLSIFGRGLGLA